MAMVVMDVDDGDGGDGWWMAMAVMDGRLWQW